jgi:Bicoid-interacting protein 3 (Bin3)
VSDCSSDLLTTFVDLGRHSFSISKWIHLNGGDDALMRFFQRVHSVLDTGGVFVLEPQTWDTYAKAKRMDQVGLFSILCILLH